jgi:hypothetical protein
MKEIRINVPLELRHTVIYPGPTQTVKVELQHGDVYVTIGGSQKDVDAFLALNEQKTGLDDGPLLPKFGAKELTELESWRESAKQRGWNSPADLRGFTALDFAELQEWRSVAKSFDLDSPKEFDSIANVSIGEILDRRLRVQLREATGCESIASAGELICQLRSRSTVAEDREIEWQLASGCASPKDAQEFRASWHAETGCMWPKEAGALIRNLRERCKNTSLPVFGSIPATGEVVFAISKSELSTRANFAEARETEIADWKSVTNRETPSLAKEMLDQMIGKTSELDNQATGLRAEIRAWKKATGADSPESAISRAGAEQDAWKEATECTNAFQAQKKIANLELKLLSYASEIDALRKASPKKEPFSEEWYAKERLNSAEHEKRVATERELSKVRAELDSKRRECQTEKERADKAEQDVNHLRAIYSDARASAGLHATIGEGENLSKWCQDARESKREADTWKTEALTCGVTLADIRKALESKFSHLGPLANIPWAEFGKKAVAAINSAIVPLPKPDKVEAGQKWAVIATVGYVYGSVTDSHPVDMSNLGIIPDQKILTSNDWVCLSK